MTQLFVRLRKISLNNMTKDTTHNIWRESQLAWLESIPFLSRLTVWLLWRWQKTMTMSSHEQTQHKMPRLKINWLDLNLFLFIKIFCWETYCWVHLTVFHADPFGDRFSKILEQTDIHIHGNMVVSFKDTAWFWHHQIQNINSCHYRPKDVDS